MIRYFKVLVLCFLVISCLLQSSCDKKSTEPKPVVANPVMNPAGNMYSQSQTVTITCPTAGAEIHYTLDGNEPTESSDLYTGSIAISANKTIKARAFLDGYTPSSIVTQIYEIYPIVPKEMVFVEGGTFQMGGGTYYNASPAHTVTLSSFYISKYEETQKEWRSIMNDDDFNEEDGLGDNYPAYGITWYKALYYCNKKSIIAGLTPCYSKNGVSDPRYWGAIPTANYNPAWDSITCNWSANGYRLPTEAEWEFAGMGGNLSNGYLYAGSNNCSDVAWFNSYISRPVGQKPANELGLFDMSGNAEEMCWDWLSEYSSESSNNPTGSSNGIKKVSRGGGWSTGIGDMLIKARLTTTPYSVWPYSGLRLVRSVR